MSLAAPLAISFATPLALVGLLLIPLLAGWYLAAERGRRRAAAAFVMPALTASVTPLRPRWRRHVPVLALALALTALILAAARPQTTVAVPVERASIMLVTDVSGSMLATDIAPNRLTAARLAAQRFVAGVPRRVNVGVMVFNQSPRLLQSPTLDRASVDDALHAMTPSGGTATGEAINGALRTIDTIPGTIGGKRPPAAIVLLSDGASTRGVDPLAAARDAGRQKVPIYTVALGTANGTITVPRPGGGGTETRKVPPDPTSLAEIARLSGGKSFTATDAGRLSEVYQRLGSQLGRKQQQREITAGFAGGGLALLLLGMSLSLGWFGRPI